MEIRAGPNTSSKTVLVVGAGASYELDIPTGYKLAERIIGDIDYNPNYTPTNGEGQFVDLINQYLVVTGRKSDNETEREANRNFFHEYLVPFREELRKWTDENKSIDAFLNQETISDMERQFGRMAIAYYILGQEENLMRENLYGFRENWIRAFLEKHLHPIKSSLCTGQTPVQIVTFNYDRIIEHFLYTFLRQTSDPVIPGIEKNIGTDESRQMVDQFGIVHVYEKLAHLEWQQHGGNFIRFGERNNVNSHLTYASKTIRLIAETGIGRIRCEQIEEIQKITKGAKKIYLLGFGFDEENMKILFGERKPEKSTPRDAPCFATAYGLDPGIKVKYPFIHFYDLTCARLVNDSNIFRI